MPVGGRYPALVRQLLGQSPVTMPGGGDPLPGSGSSREALPAVAQGEALRPPSGMLCRPGDVCAY